MRQSASNRILLLAGISVLIAAPLSGRDAWADNCGDCRGLDGFVEPETIDDDVRRMVGKYRGGTGPENVAVQRARGVIETGLFAVFADHADCPGIDSEAWAIDYSHKRSGAALHKGVDIPQPRGMPIRAVADGMVVGRFLNHDNRKGIEIVLRHTPEQTGLPFWTYSQYTHLLELPALPVGAAVQIGEEIGKTGNSGKMGKRVRRDALHFAILYSGHPDWSNDGEVAMPRDGYFMDPTAFYRSQPPYDSVSLAHLVGEQKAVPVPYIRQDGVRIPAGARRVWPFACR